MFKKIFIFAVIILLIPIVFLQITNYSVGQNNTQLFQQFETIQEDPEYIRIVFYNVENLFDIYDDSLKNDEEFTPAGIKNWNYKKFQQKLNNIYKTIIAIGEWEPPAIVCLCEIENRYVLNKLVYETPLKKFNYKIIHEESPDLRGIDVALLYRPKKFKPLFHKAIPVIFPFDTAKKTRDILYVKGVVFNEDTLHLFVNHWPSRYGGLLATKSLRNFTASVLKNTVDSIFENNSSANILIMGDFNDEPTDQSLTISLNAVTDTINIKSAGLINLMALKQKTLNEGTLKYKNNWNFFDQFIVSYSLFNGNNKLHIDSQGAQIFNADFLKEEDSKYLGIKPFRTYSGPKYLGGFSDHFPVYIDLFAN